VAAIESLCRQMGVQMAVFGVIGQASILTVGTYDQKQQVYATEQQEGFFEILACTGNVSRQENRPVVHGRIMVADMDGRVTGGTLFSGTRLYAGEIDLQELLGPPLDRAYHAGSGLMQWLKAP